MVERSLEINTRDENNVAVKKSFGNVNPNASNLVLKSFATSLNGLTTHTLVSVKKIDTEDITNAE